jgi:hypothetical protein
MVVALMVSHSSLCCVTALPTSAGTCNSNSHCTELCGATSTIWKTPQQLWILPGDKTPVRHGICVPHTSRPRIYFQACQNKHDNVTKASEVRSQEISEEQLTFRSHSFSSLFDEWITPTLERIQDLHVDLCLRGEAGDGLALDERLAGSRVNKIVKDRWSVAAMTIQLAQREGFSVQTLTRPRQCRHCPTPLQQFSLRPRPWGSRSVRHDLHRLS